MTSMLRVGALPVVLIALVMSACSSDSCEDPGSDAILDRLGTVQDNFDNAPALEITVSGDSVPAQAGVLHSATGVGNSSPAFDGSVVVGLGGGSTTEADVIAVDGDVWVNASLLPGGWIERDRLPINLDDVPDPASFFAVGEGISSLLGLTEEPVLSDCRRDADTGQVVDQIEGRLDGAFVQRFLPTADDNGDFDVTYYLTEDDELTRIFISGPLYGSGSSASYSLRLSATDSPVDIQAP